MRDNDAYLTVVFPSNFDKLIDDRQNGLTDIKPEILTYYRTNSMEYSAMKDGFINEYLSGYQSQIRADYGLLITSVEDSEILDYPIATRDMEYGFKAVTQNLNRTFVPILLFIILLYTSMSIGTNVIAGQKERGTFTGILLTPMPRYNIVLGYLLGVVLKAMIPAGIAAFIIELLTFNFSITCLLAIMLYLLVLELFIASLTIMISVINDTVVSAQTAFLPIFLVLVSVCVTCIQSAQDRLEFYLYLPVHGQFYGIGDAYNGTVDPAALASSSFLTLIIAVIAIVVAVRLLYSERYTVSVETIKDRDMSKRGIGYFIEKLNKSTDHFNYIITEIFYPLFTLSFYQFLAMIPVVVSYMRKAEYSSYIQDLANVGTVSDIITKSFEVISIFFTDPLYLGLMTVGYVAIIIHYIVHSKRFFKIKKFKDTCAKVGYPLTSGKRSCSNQYGLWCSWMWC